MFFRSRLSGWSAVSSETDGAGGLWVRNQQDDELYRYAADCHFRLIPGAPENIEHIAAHPQLPAAFFLTRDGQLGLVDEQGVRWTRSLPAFRSHSRFVARTVAALDSGQVLVPYVAEDLEPRLAAFSDSGQPLWTISPQSDPMAFSSFAQGALIQTENSLTGRAETQLIDATGNARWVVPFQFLRIGQPLNRADARFASFIGYADGAWPAPEVRQVITVDLENGDWQVTEIDRDDQVVATLDNGDLIVRPFQQDGSGGGQLGGLTRIRPGSAPQPIVLADALVLEHVHDIRSDSLGSFIVAGGEGRTSLYLTDPQQQALFSYRIPDPANHWFLGLALNQSRACALLQRGRVGNESPRIELHCVDRQNGQAAFAPVVLEGQHFILRPQIGDYIEVFRSEQTPATNLKRTRIGLNGEILTLDKPLPAPFNSQIEVTAVSFPDSGHSVFFTRFSTHILAQDSESEEWLGVINDFTARSRSNIEKLANAVVDQDRMALIGGHPITGQNRLVEFDLASRRVNWLTNIPSGEPRSRVLSRAENSWVVSDISFVESPPEPGTEHALFVRVFDDRNGQLRGEYQRDLDQRLYSAMRIAGAGNQIALQTHLSGATRIDWIDVFSGESTATALLPISHDFQVVSESLPNGRLLMAGRSHGATYPQLAVSRVSAQSRPRKVDPQASRWAGAWFTPALNGQGFFIDPLDDQNQIFAAWFTFESSPTPNQRGLRWYTALGPAPAGNGVSVLTLYENRGGVFDQAPVTEATEIGSMRLWETIAGDLVAELRLDEKSHDLSFELTRLSPAASLDGARTWFNPASSGQGLLLSSTADDPGPLAFGWFTFDPVEGSASETRQHWFIGLTDAAPAQGGRREARLYRTQGGIKGLQATSNTQAVGTASLSSINCNTLSLEYQFDQSDVAAEFAGRSGTTTLVSVEDCR
ncbi:MAG: hypothetical protein ACXIUM_10615 [Wenzhouxiangella sp.]